MAGWEITHEGSKIDDLISGRLGAIDGELHRLGSRLCGGSGGDRGRGMDGMDGWNE